MSKNSWNGIEFSPYGHPLHKLDFVVFGIIILAAKAIEITNDRIGPALVKIVRENFKLVDIKSGSVNQALSRLQKQGVIKITKTDIGSTITLTATGKIKLDQYYIHDLVLPEPPKIWDQQWRIILFDIPEELKHLRSILRNKLKQLGFKYLQKSSWVYPYPCEELLIKLIKRLNISDYVRIIIALKISTDSKLKKHFNLNFNQISLKADSHTDKFNSTPAKSSDIDPDGRKNYHYSGNFTPLKTKSNPIDTNPESFKKPRRLEKSSLDEEIIPLIEL